MIAKFLNAHEAEKRFNSILANYREEAERERKGKGNRNFADKYPVLFNEENRLITICFLRFTAYYQLLDDEIELWMDDFRYGIDDEYVPRKITNMFNALKSSTQRMAPEPEPEQKPEPEQLPEKESVSLFTGAELSNETFEKNRNLLQQWLDRHNMTVDQLEEEFGFVRGAIRRQLRRSKYGRFKKWWRQNIILGGKEQ